MKVKILILDLNSLGPNDGPIRTETCSPTINKVYIGHLLVVLDGCFINIILEDDLNKIETCWSVFKCFNVNILD